MGVREVKLLWLSYHWRSDGGRGRRACGLVSRCNVGGIGAWLFVVDEPECLVVGSESVAA